MKKVLLKDVMKLGGDIVASERFAKAKRVPHHNKNGNIADHSLETADYALALTRWLRRHGILVNERDVVRTSLLHDVGMTEDDVFHSPSRKKAYSHPREGARIAREEFGLDEIEAEAILHHMWPICLTPPHSALGWVVSAADKWCSMNETWHFASGALKNVPMLWKHSSEHIDAS